MMRPLRLLAVCGIASLFPCASAYALSVRALVNGGYVKLNADTEDARGNKLDHELKGYTVGALAGVGFLDTVPGFSLLALGGLRYENMENDGEYYTVKLNPTMAAFEVGPEFSVIPLLRLQAVVGYDMAISGKAKYEFKSSGLSVNSEEDLKSLSRFNVTGRALFTIAPLISAGLEPSYHSGKFEVDTKNAKTNDFSGFSIKGVIAFTL